MCLLLEAEAPERYCVTRPMYYVLRYMAVARAAKRMQARRRSRAHRCLTCWTVWFGQPRGAPRLPKAASSTQAGAVGDPARGASCRGPVLALQLTAGELGRGPRARCLLRQRPARLMTWTRRAAAPPPMAWPMLQWPGRPLVCLDRRSHMMRPPAPSRHTLAPAGRSARMREASERGRGARGSPNPQALRQRQQRQLQGTWLRSMLPLCPSARTSSQWLLRSPHNGQRRRSSTLAPSLRPGHTGQHQRP